MVDFTEHSLRYQLSNEVHTRPFERLRPPERASYLAVLSGERGAEADRAHVGELCRRYGVPTPDHDATHYRADFGAFRLKWERHTEFSNYTFFRTGRFRDPFADPVISRVPADWLETLPGEVLVAMHVAVEPRSAPERRIGDLHDFFVADSLTGGLMAGGKAYGWTDFRIHEDGFGRVLIHDRGLRSRQAGRLVQRLLEIETYRMLALLALPEARAVLPELTRIEQALAAITAEMAALEGIEDERTLLDRLMALAADIERLKSRNAFRFGAAAAYYALVEARIRELREVRVEGVQTLGEFTERRLAPAMRTCEAAARRQELLAQRIAGATALLRTRVDLALEETNQRLLQSMDRRARLQLRLQQTVEGLSVAAISYYVIGLLSYLVKAIEAAGVPVDDRLALGVAIPLVVGGVWYGIRRVRKSLRRSGPAPEEEG